MDGRSTPKHDEISQEKALVAQEIRTVEAQLEGAHKKDYKTVAYLRECKLKLLEKENRLLEKESKYLEHTNIVAQRELETARAGAAQGTWVMRGQTH